MGADSKIEWTHNTFNPWWGCTRVSPGCENCYAETFDKRVSGKERAHWGVSAERRFFGDAHWNEPLKWNASAEKRGVRERVFCASMADVFEDRAELQPHRMRLAGLIRATPWLDWLLLTKRIENAKAILREMFPGGVPANVWVGCTVEDQARVTQRVSQLLLLREIGVRVLFLSCEPLLGAVDVSFWLRRRILRTHDGRWMHNTDAGVENAGGAWVIGVDWVIVGGESGHGARRCDVAWARSLVKQCREAGVAVHVKQLGAFVVDRNDAGFNGNEEDSWDFGGVDPVDCVEHDLDGTRDGYQGAPVRVRLRNKKGGDWDEWPEDLRIREYPEVQP